MEMNDLIQWLSNLKAEQQRLLEKGEDELSRDNIEGGISMLNFIIGQLRDEQIAKGEYPPKDSSYLPEFLKFTLKPGLRVETTFTWFRCREGGKRYWRLMDLDDNILKAGITCGCGYGCNGTDCIQDTDQFGQHNTVLEEFRVAEGEIVKPLSFGENLRLLRKKAGITQTQLGERVGVHYRTVLRWEADENEPSITMLVKIADALDCSVDELVQKD